MSWYRKLAAADRRRSNPQPRLWVSASTQKKRVNLPARLLVESRPLHIYLIVVYRLR